MSNPLPLATGPAEPGVWMLYEQGPCYAVWKPGGVLSQAPPGIDSMEVRLRAYLKRREQKTGNIYLAIVHRLDRPVSGVMLFARHVRAARRLAEQFQQRRVHKTYWALLQGQLDPPEQCWVDWMRKVPGEPRSELVPADHPGAQRAELAVRLLGCVSGASWVEIQLQTGRMHQIRLQAACRGHPVLGDWLYGSQIPFGPPVTDERDRWIALHARKIEFLHPMTRQPVSVVAPIPECWPRLPAE
ncbi:MAG: RNA pseudouridine synthase [Pirellulaceae bacterium]|nr:MAG: RNA pseudouridine synthase [Pirellulaceae bacterium]